jgi:eukaryotic-like serine/threonine-protein kinase
MAENWMPSARLQQLCQDQRERWHRGDNARVEAYLEQHPELCSDEKLLLDFICAEYTLRQEHGESPALAEYIERFPQLAPQLQVLFEVLEAIDSEPSLQASGQETTTGLRVAVPPNDGSQETLTTMTAKDRPTRGGAAGGLAPCQFGQYELVEEVARGGMGIVYKARQRKLDRIVALKMILLDSESAVRRFQFEAEAAAKLDHPGVVPIHDVGEHNGQHYLCMAFVDGESLAARVSRGPLPPDEAARIVRDVAEAVQHAHERGIIHRDLKPANIMIDGTNRPRVTDFGLARKSDVVGALTTDGSIFGTPSYMSPEQASGRTARIGPACDIYALGAVLFHLLTGQPPFAGSNVLEIIRQVCEDAPKALCDVDAALPKPLEAICLNCLAKDPQDRYPMAAALADDLNRFLQREPISQLSERRHSASPKWTRRPVAVGIVGVFVLFLLGAAVWSRSLARRSSDTAQVADDGRPALLNAPFDKDEAKAKRAAWAQYQQIHEQRKNSIDMELVLIPAGRFSMGSPETANELMKAFPYAKKGWFAGDRPVHRVTISHSFYLGKYEVTKGQFKKFVENVGYRTDAEKDGKGGFGYTGNDDKRFEHRPSFSWRDWGIEEGDTSPVVNVSWNDALAFCEWLSKKEGEKYRLPTEAEWEYACRAGTVSRYYNGENPEDLIKIANVWDAAAKEKDPTAINNLNSSDGWAFTSPVGRFRPNNFGLYDMIGNAAEWCSDWYDEDYYSKSPEPDPLGPAAGSVRVIRGGGWSHYPVSCRCAARGRFGPARCNSRIGFRVVCPR